MLRGARFPSACRGRLVVWPVLNGNKLHDVQLHCLNYTLDDIIASVLGKCCTNGYTNWNKTQEVKSELKPKDGSSVRPVGGGWDNDRNDLSMRP